MLHLDCFLSKSAYFSQILFFWFFFFPGRVYAFKLLWLNELIKKFQVQTIFSSIKFLVPENNLDIV